MRRDCRIVRLTGERSGALAVRDALGEAVSGHAQLRFVAQGEREQPTVAGPLQHADRLPASLLGVRAFSCHPPDPRQPPQASAKLAQIPQRAVQFDRTPLGFDRLVDRSDRVALDRVLSEQFGALARGEPAFVLEHETEVGDGLAVRASTGRVSCGGRTVPDDGVLVTCLRGMMDDPRHIRSVVFDQGGEDAPVQGYEPRRWHRIGDGAPRQLVPEGEPARGHGQQAAFLGCCQRCHARQAGARNERVNQPAFERGRDDGQLLKHVLSRGIQAPDPCQHGIGDRRRNTLALGRGKQLMDEERIPGCEREQVMCIDCAARTELLHGLLRQPVQRQMPYVVAAGCLAQQAVKRVLAGQLVVAVGQDQDGRQVGDPPDEVTQRVECRVVGPVNVLNNQNCRMLGPGQFRTQGGEHAVAVTAVRHRVAELGSYAAHQVAERAKGPRGRQIVAVADQHPALGGQVRAQGLDQAGLADPRLTHDQRNGPAPVGGRPHGTGEHRQFGLALQDPRAHTKIVKGWQSCERAARPGYDASSGRFARRAAMR